MIDDLEGNQPSSYPEGDEMIRTMQQKIGMAIGECEGQNDTAVVSAAIGCTIAAGMVMIGEEYAESFLDSVLAVTRTMYERMKGSPSLFIDQNKNRMN